MPRAPKTQVPKNKAVSVYVDDGEGNYRPNEDGNFPTDGYVLNTEKSGCTNGGVLSQNPETKTISLSVSGSDQCHVYFDKELYNAVDYIIKNSQGKLNVSFENSANTDEGVFEMEDDYGTSYYFRGAVTNNYVKFADFYWRIVRINGDGSMRIIYAGTTIHSNDNQNDDTFISRGKAFNSTNSDVKYVGFMFGPTGTSSSTSKNQAESNVASSDIKKVLDTWYSTHLSAYTQNIKDAVFCFDRSTGTSDWQFTNEAYGTYKTTYISRTRFNSEATGYIDSTPSFKCNSKNDKYTVSDSINGNAKLTYPIGLLSVDEAVAAGSGKADTPSNYYLKRTFWYWTGSPSYFTNFAGVYNINSNGSLGNYSVNNGGAIAPVINLTAEYALKLKGTGNIDSPYQIS